MKDWYDIYIAEIKLKGTTKDYIDYKIKSKKKLIKLIKKYSPNKKIAEAGAGTGIISTYMASLGYNVTEIDIDSKIQSLAKKIAKDYYKDAKINFAKKDILKLDYKEKEFDVIFSNGVLEHFSDEDIKKILTCQIKQSNYVIVGIPTSFFNDEEALHGDERFLDISYWRNLINKAGGTIIEEISFDYRTLKEVFQTLNRVFRPLPFRAFVITKK